ncbi:bifunctional tetrahydrofolate synthase/dihydrofolate synthase [Shewanella sp. JM162201]|uniref:Dihydrofolate synthase/folylpolyglutamate synthase n=1 Tax=Shewanella jiangmenensis TaxID=2837387 RepID=A0ABS5V8Z6_9GAMM|nr:bifunctional tetrahydrofolate synthase/dihydrofolate synthase [Shewanella jiangmenensis]MBT1446342.1 bifunctional tetrahydrofolate synthase/dihydrofolate synthase [Shewanella jiangmenensis]
MLSRPQPGSSLGEWLDYLLAIHPTEIDMGLARVSEVARRLGVSALDDSLVITVGGTNGKGSTCTMLESVLRRAGYRVGVYTSPHMLKYNERIRIEGEDAPDADIIAAFEAIDTARGELSLTFFEFATLAGLMLFKAAKLDVVILEVGLGGRLDATNLIDADISVITAVDLDHQAFLGNTRESVGREKAGIFRHDRPAIVGDADMPLTVAEVAASVGARLYRVGEHFSYSRQRTTWDYQGKRRAFSNMPLPQLPLPNAATVIAVIEAIGERLVISDEAIVQGISAARLGGRLEEVSSSPLVIVDVAHNPHAARYLRDELQSRWQGKRVLALCGMLKDKDYAEVLRIMHPAVAQWYLVSLEGERGASAALLANAMPAGAQYQCFDHMPDAKAAILNAADAADVVIVFGSFYTVSGFKSLI